MSKQIDERVVEMRFDNSNFERNTKETMNSVDRLKEKLDFTGSGKGLDVISSKISALQVMGVTALANLTNAAVNAGKKIVSALTLEPIMTGFSEYETKIGAIQTILANTKRHGTTLDDVNKTLDDLNGYADQTIYNFAQMTQSIGMFTTAGVDLETSTSAVKGIANLAAYVGAPANDATRAMYQLSQALSTGQVRLQDWMSLEHTAGMAGKEFQDRLIETAKVYGTGVDAAIEKHGNFRESLVEGWLTTEVLTQTLAQFAGEVTEESLRTRGFNEEQIKSIMELGKTATASATEVKTLTQLWSTLKETAQSGWAQTWQYIIGDFEEAKGLFTEVNKVIGGMLDSMSLTRNKLFKGWSEGGGRDSLIRSINNIFNGIMSIITPIKEAFREIFPPTTVEQLITFTEKIENLTSKFKLEGEAAENLKRTFKGFFAALDIGRQFVVALAQAIAPIFGITADLGGGILSVTGTFGDWIVKLNEFIKTSGVFNTVAGFMAKAFSGVYNVFKTLFNAGRKFIEPFVTSLQNGMTRVSGATGTMKEGFEAFVNYIGDALSNSEVLKSLKVIWDSVVTIVSGILKALSQFAQGISEKISEKDFSWILDLVNTGILATIGAFIIKFVRGFGKIVDSVDGFIDSIKNIFDAVTDCFKSMEKVLNASALMLIASAIMILAMALLVLSSIESKKLYASLEAITVLFVDLMGSMAIFNKYGADIKNVRRVTAYLIAFSVAISILAGALKKISDLDFKELAVGLVGVYVLAEIMVFASRALSTTSKSTFFGLSKTSGAKIRSGMMEMVLFAGALYILAGACKKLSDLEWDDLARGLTGVGALMAATFFFMKFAKFPQQSMKTAASMVILAGAIWAMAYACKPFANMGWEEMIRGLVAVGSIMGAMAGFSYIAGGASSKRVLAASVSLIAIAGAMKIIASACRDFGNMGDEELIKGIGTVIGTMIALVVAMKLLTKGGAGSLDIMSIGLSMATVAASLFVVSAAIEKIGKMDKGQAGKGLFVIATALAALAGGLHLMKGSILGSAALAIAAASILTLAPALAILGSMDIDAIITSLVALGGSLLILGIAGKALASVSVSVNAVGLAMLEIGVGLLAVGGAFVLFGLGLSLIAEGLEAIGNVGPGVADALVLIVTKIVKGIIDLVPVIIEALGQIIPAISGFIAEAVVAIIGIFNDALPAIGEFLINLITTVNGVLIECVPIIADGTHEIIVKVLQSLVKFAPSIIEELLTLIIIIIDGVTAKMPDLMQSITNLVTAFCEALVKSFNDLDFRLVLDATGALLAFLTILNLVAALIPGAMLGVLGLGLLVAEIALILAALGRMAQSEWLVGFIEDSGDLLGAIGSAIGSFIGGLTGAFAEGVSAGLPGIGKHLSDFMTNAKPFIDGANQIDPASMQGIKSLAEAILILTAADILEGLTTFITGGSSLVEFGRELAAFGPYMAAYSESISGIKPDVVVASATAAKSLAEMAKTLPNSGGLIATITGDNSLYLFAVELAKFGTKFKEYALSVDGIKPDVVINSANAAKALAEMANNLPNQGGLISTIIGDNSLYLFAVELAQFGTKFKEYALSIEGIKPEVVTSSANAAKALGEMAKALPNSGGLLSTIVGDNTLSRFGAELALFGPYMKLYSDSIGEIKPDVVTSSANAAKALAEMASIIPNQGGLLSLMGNGSKNLATFGDQLEQFGSAIKRYANQVSGIGVASVTASTTALKEIISMVTSLDGVNFNAINNFDTAMSKFGTTGIRAFINSISSSAAQLKDAGGTVITKFVSGVSENSPKIDTTMADLIKNAVATLNSKSTDFHTAGGYVVDGFASGITADTWKAEAAALAMAEAAVQAAREALHINSPSKVFYEIGSFAGEGLVNALDDYGSKAYNAGSGIADYARRGLNDAIKRIGDVIHNDIDSQPTIRPVVDLSDVESGASAIRSIFGSSLSVGVVSNVSSVGAMMNQRGQNGTNADVVSAIKALGKDLNNVGNTTYNFEGITYDDGSSIQEAVSQLVRAARMERRT